MKRLKNWKLFTENTEFGEEEYLLKISTQYIGDENIIAIDQQFTEEDYIKYKEDNLPSRLWDDLLNQAIEEYGLDWDLEEDGLRVTTSYIGQEEFIEDDMYEFENYSEDELRNMAIDAMGIDFEVIENEEHPEYLKRKNKKDFNL